LIAGFPRQQPEQAGKKLVTGGELPDLDRLDQRGAGGFLLLARAAFD